MDASGRYSRATSPVSKIDWQGASPRKFRMSERLHFPPKDMLRHVEAPDFPVLGRRHFHSKPSSPVREERSGVRVFPLIHNRHSDTSDFESFGKLAYVSSQKKMLFKLKLSGAEALKQIKAKSLVMPPAFSGIKDKKKGRDSQVFGPPRNMKSRPSQARLNWRERERIQEKSNDVQNVQELTNWEESFLKSVILPPQRSPSPIIVRKERFIRL